MSYANTCGHDDGCPDIRVLKDHDVRVRKEGRCAACGLPILKGEWARSTAWLEDGEFRSERRHRGLCPPVCKTCAGEGTEWLPSALGEPHIQTCSACGGSGRAALAASDTRS